MALIKIKKTKTKVKGGCGYYFLFRCDKCGREYLSVKRTNCGFCDMGIGRSRIYACKFCGRLAVTPASETIGLRKYCRNNYCGKQSKKKMYKTKKMLASMKNQGNKEWQSLTGEAAKFTKTPYQELYPEALGL